MIIIINETKKSTAHEKKNEFAIKGKFLENREKKKNNNL
jgi:hypothetical protein